MFAPAVALDLIAGMFGRRALPCLVLLGGALAQEETPTPSWPAEFTAFFHKLGLDVADAPARKSLHLKSMVGDDALVLSRLLAAGALPSLEVLSVRGNPLGDLGVGVIAAAVVDGAVTAHLQELDVSDTELTDAGM